MEVSYRDILATVAVANELLEMDLPGKYMIKVVQGIRKAREAMKDINDMRERIIEKYQISEDSDEEKITSANMELDEALNATTEIDFKPINLSSLEQPIKGRLLDASYWMWQF